MSEKLHKARRCRAIRRLAGAKVEAKSQFDSANLQQAVAAAIPPYPPYGGRGFSFCVFGGPE